MRKLLVLTLAAVLLTAAGASAAKPKGVEASYHGHLALGTGLGMLEKWCALPNFSFDQQGGIGGWTSQSCNGCHIGAAWNPTKETDCTYCHQSTRPVKGSKDKPTIAKCMTCHSKDTSKRGDLFTAATDVHIAAGMVCQDCHVRTSDKRKASNHQFLKGTAIDTTEPTMEGTVDCISCHSTKPHGKKIKGSKRLNKHVAKVACETCHTGARPAGALKSRRWDKFSSGKPVTAKRSAGWYPKYKWYDNTGPGATGDYHLPILTATERRGKPAAKIYPFNPVRVDWFVKTPSSHYDDVIIPPDVKAADANGDGTVTVAEMRVVYPGATLETADMNFSISHSVLPRRKTMTCTDCHTGRGWLLDWQELGYSGDPIRKRKK